MEPEESVTDLCHASFVVGQALNAQFKAKCRLEDAWAAEAKAKAWAAETKANAKAAQSADISNYWLTHAKDAEVEVEIAKKNVYLAADTLAIAFREVASAISAKNKYSFNVVVKSNPAEEVADAAKAKASNI